jgi:hypothetical protein
MNPTDGEVSAIPNSGSKTSEESPADDEKASFGRFYTPQGVS